MVILKWIGHQQGNSFNSKYGTGSSCKHGNGHLSSTKRRELIHYVRKKIFYFIFHFGATAPSGPGPSHSRGF